MSMHYSRIRARHLRTIALYLLLAAAVAAVLWYWPRPFYGMPLHSAIVRSDMPAVESWATADRINDRLAHPFLTVYEDYTPLMFAVEYDNKEAFDLLIARGVYVKSSTGTGITAAWIAATHARYDMLRVLVKNDARIMTTHMNGETLLHVAVASGCVECVELLVKKGLRPDQLDENGISPIDLCLGNQPMANVDVLKALNPTKEQFCRATRCGTIQEQSKNWSPEMWNEIQRILGKS